MLELLILAALVVWLVFALRSCLRRRGKGCGGCDGNCGHCGQSCSAASRRRYSRKKLSRPRKGTALSVSKGFYSHFFFLKYASSAATMAALTRITAG